LLAVGFGAIKPGTMNGETSGVRDAFVTALELFRLRRRDEIQADIRELLAAFAGNLSASFNLAHSLEAFCKNAKWLFGADRLSVWMHDRRARQLALFASSDPEHLAHGLRLAADDPLTPAAAAMRRARAAFLTEPPNHPSGTVVVPLRGRRRALGLLMLEGVRPQTDEELDLLDRADELGLALSTVIENMQLLTDAIETRRDQQHPNGLAGYLVAVCDQSGRLLYANEAFTKRAKLDPDEALGRPVAECLGPDLAAWLNSVPGPNTGTPEVREVVDPRLKGPLLASVASLVDASQAVVGRILVARDLASQSMLETQREELRNRLTQSEKLVALGQFIAGIAHELNNPLQGVLGHLELLRTTGAFPSHLDGEVQTIYKEAERAAKIVHNLLVFAGSRRLSRRSVSLNGVLEKVVSLRKATCRAQGIEVVRHYDRKVPRVQSDPLLLHQVFLNMVMNAEQAIAATGGPGRIELSSTVSRAGDSVVATVRDTGDGIPPDSLSRIFEPFYTTKEVGKGTGLGLAIVYGIVQEHGGHISAANHPDGGAVFRVELPIRPTS
jgi:signal transduction histidine kinase